MEANHHPIAIGSHPASGEPYTLRKKCTHYFREFLMLFLANDFTEAKLTGQ